jgi:hypothetical protein
MNIPGSVKCQQHQSHCTETINVIKYKQVYKSAYRRHYSSIRPSRGAERIYMIERKECMHRCFGE